MKGRGVGYKSLEGFITVVRSIHRSAGIPEGICPTYGEKMKAIVICKMFFVGTGVFDATTHNIWKSAAVWTARCGAEEYRIREAGRWDSSDTYMIYVKSGKAIASLAASRKDGSLDPIRKIWVFHP